MIIRKYFTRISLYIKEYSIFQILIKIKSRILSQIGLRVSETIFLELKVQSSLYENKKTLDLLNISFYDDSLFNEIHKINVYKFLDIQSISEDPKQKLIVAKNNEIIVGFIFVDFSLMHNIHGIGNWKLGVGDAWMGPSFVIKKQRGQGIATSLIKFVIDYCKSIEVKQVYSCVNAENVSSIKSATNNGFVKIGKIKETPFKKLTKFFCDNKYYNKLIINKK